MGSSAAKQDLCQAVQRGDLAACQRLLGALPQGETSEASVPKVLDGLSSSGLAALHVAAGNGHIDIVRFLLDLRADVNVRDSKQRTPLHCASRALLAPNCTACVQELLRQRADPFSSTELGSTALDVARGARCSGCVRALEGSAALWQGPVDAYQPKLLVIPTWASKWLVVLRDRRHNTGPSFIARGSVHNAFKQAQTLVRDHISGPSFSHACPRCGKSNAVPDFVESFPCRHCETLLAVPTSLQLAVYDCYQGVPDAVPTAVLSLPQDPRCISVKPLEDSAWSTRGGWLQGALGGLGLASSRPFGLSVSVQDRDREVGLAVRFSTAEESTLVKRVLLNPLLSSRALVLKEAYDALLAGNTAALAEEAFPDLPPPSAPPAEDLTLLTEGPQAAAQAVHSAQGEDPAVDPGPVQEDGACVVCLERPADTAVVPCGHLCLCQRCADAMRGQTTLCPMCRNEASSTVRIYRS
ncbi:LUL3 [Symbiodinium natans]|uniref:LUL3 protein n=1 Tax=Symbiodinium natans TaxID=878477 RepID=A0A812ICK1_9DINO|nr:LUL3 [Symbiodinium natans]